MREPLIVVTGKNGQLGYQLQQLTAKKPEGFTTLFTDSNQLDLSNPTSIPSFFEQYQPDYFINTAAYTAVDKAETDQAAALQINGEAVGIIAQNCLKYDCTLLQISTDYVFKGNGKMPYTPTDKTDPVNYYGYTKWVGEKLAMENNPRSLIIRTSWLYSSVGNNFVRTMIRLMKERNEISVVSDQTGSPTYAADLANCLVHIIQNLENGNRHYGYFHYSNRGAISWFDFATTIATFIHSNCKVLPITSDQYPTPAKRPAFSVMDTSHLVNDFNCEMIDWQVSLEKCIKAIMSQQNQP